MDAPTRRFRLIRFSVFELDLDSGELFKQGRKVKLQGQPFEVLLALLDRPGEVISREELKHKVWPSEAAGDFDQGLNRAMNKLREALGDSAESPQIVETLPRRGYRFISSIQKEKSGQPALAEPSPAQVPLEAPISTPWPPAEQAKHSPSKRVWSISVAATLPALFVIGYFYFHRALHGTPKLMDKDKIVLADFKNTTGDPVFDETLRQGLAVQLEQSPFLSIVSEERIRQMLPLMGQPADAPLTPDLAREICQRTAGAAILEGSITSLGSQYVLGLRARNCGSGDVLDDEQVQAARKEDVLNALTQIASKFRTRGGESLATVEKHDTPLAEATTPSLEALKAYSAAWKLAFSTGFASAVPLLKRAIEIDPKFAMAYAFLGRNYADTGETVLSAESLSKAYELRDRASDRERFFITANYEVQVTGNLEKVQQTGELWAQTYPRDTLPHTLLSIIYQESGKYEKSIEEARKSIVLDPDFTPGYNNLAYSLLYLDRLGEAKNTVQRASERKLEIADFLVLQYYIDFLEDDRAGMERIVALARGKPGTEDWMAQQEAFVAAYSGHLQEARRSSRRAVDLAQRAGQPERAAIYEAGAAVWEALFGNAPAARRSALEALELSKGRDVEYGAALALALAGDSSRSQALANDLGKRFPEDTFVKFRYVPTLRALSALNHDRPSQAVQVLQIAVPYELAIPGTSVFGFFGSLYPVYVRGEAYLTARQGAEAAVEFQKILNHPGLMFSDPMNARVRLQLGRALALSGDKAKARTAYQDFLILWKDADADISIFEQAKAEYAKMQ